MIGLPYGEKTMTIIWAVFIQYQRVTDRQTDGQTELVYQYCASAAGCWRAIKMKAGAMSMNFRDVFHRYSMSLNTIKICYCPCPQLQCQQYWPTGYLFSLTFAAHAINPKNQSHGTATVWNERATFSQNCIFAGCQMHQNTYICMLNSKNFLGIVWPLTKCM